MLCRTKVFPLFSLNLHLVSLFLRCFPLKARTRSSSQIESLRTERSRNLPPRNGYLPPVSHLATVAAQACDQWSRRQWISWEAAWWLGVFVRSSIWKYLKNPKQWLKNISSLQWLQGKYLKSRQWRAAFFCGWIFPYCSAIGNIWRIQALFGTP